MTPHTRRAFTLIELLVVIALIAVQPGRSVGRDAAHPDRLTPK